MASGNRTESNVDARDKAEVKLRFTDLIPNAYYGDGSQEPLAFFLKYKDYCRLHKLTEKESIERFIHCVADVARKD